MANQTVERVEQNGHSAQDQAKAIATLPANLAILKMENESIQALAAARPRDMTQIKNELAATLEAFPVLAETAIYSKPVGKVVDCRCDDCKRTFEAAVKWNDKGGYVCPKCGESNQVRTLSRPRQKFARGLSIRAAETLREAYGFNRVRADVIVVDENTVKIEATFVDYQRGTMTQLPVMLSRVYKNRRGQMESIPEDRFFDNVVKGAVSKAIREAVVRSVNPGMRLWFEGECERMQADLLTDDKIDQIVQSFGAWDLDLPKLEDLIGKTRKAGWTLEDRKRLHGIYTGLKSGDLSVEELFADDEPRAGSGNGSGTGKGSGTGPVTPEALKGGKATSGRRPVTKPGADETKPAKEDDRVGPAPHPNPLFRAFKETIVRLDDLTEVDLTTKEIGDAVIAGKLDAEEAKTLNNLLEMQAAAIKGGGVPK